jgi:hypothetical protein
MTEFLKVKINAKTYLVCREKPEGKGRPTITVYADHQPPKIRRRIEKAIVEARHGQRNLQREGVWRLPREAVEAAEGAFQPLREAGE